MAPEPAEAGCAGTTAWSPDGVGIQPQRFLLKRDRAGDEQSRRTRAGIAAAVQAPCSSHWRRTVCWHIAPAQFQSVEVGAVPADPAAPGWVPGEQSSFEGSAVPHGIAAGSWLERCVAPTAQAQAALCGPHKTQARDSESAALPRSPAPVHWSGWNPDLWRTDRSSCGLTSNPIVSVRTPTRSPSE